jgi:hypothetical protein
VAGLKRQVTSDIRFHVGNCLDGVLGGLTACLAELA